MLIKVSFTIFFFIKLVCCEETFKLLSHDKSLSEYKKYCVAKYEKFSKPQGYDLEKVIVIHRHGDRTPIDFYKSKWEEENCCLCKFNSTQNSISDCKKTKCHNGDLTLKGFQQLKSLGEFIKKSYPEQIKDIEIYVSKYPRTWGSVFGLINGISTTDTVKNVKLAPEYSLYPVTNCENRINILSSPTSNFYDSLKEENQETSPERISDNLFTHICNDIQINCKILTCDTNKIKKYIEANRKTWFEENKIVEKNERIIKLDFGILAGKILELFQNDTKMHIFSAHDNTISSVLTGFGTGIFEKPNYASVIFIEKLSKNNSFFYRLLYNGKPMKTIITPENVILNEKEFNEYLKLLTITREEITDLCADNT